MTSAKNKDVNRTILTKYIKIVYFMIKNLWAVSEKFASFMKFIGEDLGETETSVHI